jgi:hypothetical protein
VQRQGRGVSSSTGAASGGGCKRLCALLDAWSLPSIRIQAQKLCVALRLPSCSLSPLCGNILSNTACALQLESNAERSGKRWRSHATYARLSAASTATMRCHSSPARAILKAGSLLNSSTSSSSAMPQSISCHNSRARCSSCAPAASVAEPPWPQVHAMLSPGGMPELPATQTSAQDGSTQDGGSQQQRPPRHARRQTSQPRERPPVDASSSNPTPSLEPPEASHATSDGSSSGMSLAVAIRSRVRMHDHLFDSHRTAAEVSGVATVPHRAQTKQPLRCKPFAKGAASTTGTAPTASRGIGATELSRALQEPPLLLLQKPANAAGTDAAPGDTIGQLAIGRLCCQNVGNDQVALGQCDGAEQPTIIAPPEQQASSALAADNAGLSGHQEDVRAGQRQSASQRSVYRGLSQRSFDDRSPVSDVQGHSYREDLPSTNRQAQAQWRQSNWSQPSCLSYRQPTSLAPGPAGQGAWKNSGTLGPLCSRAASPGPFCELDINEKSLRVPSGPPTGSRSRSHDCTDSLTLPDAKETCGRYSPKRASSCGRWQALDQAVQTSLDLAAQHSLEHGRDSGQRSVANVLPEQSSRSTFPLDKPSTRASDSGEHSRGHSVNDIPPGIVLSPSTHIQNLPTVSGPFQTDHTDSVLRTHSNAAPDEMPVAPLSSVPLGMLAAALARGRSTSGIVHQDQGFVGSNAAERDASTLPSVYGMLSASEQGGQVVAEGVQATGGSNVQSEDPWWNLGRGIVPPSSHTAAVPSGSDVWTMQVCIHSSTDRAITVCVSQSLAHHGNLTAAHAAGCHS